MGKSETEKIVIKPFDITKMSDSFVCICIGPPQSGKTSFCLNYAYYNRDKIPCAYVATGSETAYKSFLPIFGPLYTRNYYNENEHKMLIERKRIMALENGKNNKSNFILEIFDDFGDEPKIFKSKMFRGTIKIGTQHWSQRTFINLQAMCDFEKSSRQNVAYVAIFKQNDMNEREKLYRQFGGVCGTYEKFCKILDACTDNYKCLVISLLSSQGNFEDRVFYYKTDNPEKFTDTKVAGEWRFGSAEAWDWQKDRYNKNFEESIDGF